jgi:hypothetical protein
VHLRAHEQQLGLRGEDIKTLQKDQANLKAGFTVRHKDLEKRLKAIEAALK